ncbi:mismatch repair protein MLH2 NDAI_0E01800 [Naumovozyma dairenensis CBS 421]|uniref:EF-hand domain-containing protein n=1 Tax=Naumovozyma dairenensis (strain ATCC 10597 / BCRC 20456 / CBS 421 / NBRC 0211 / NRRL Y-12639) TaxID=1071378 RepID=G0WB76_NAUDC|nr:hypothetical protein NDAI_0E01800 [Naumovozyma dairenensis CBS 421]CCD24996.1 hypothetical protein NDAI_0E01800 [Naumovozyma dairenensis CBS 421]
MAIKEISTNSKWKIVSSSFILGPTSVVHELLDNSVDSGATTIYIDVDSKTGGCEYISVKDNGSGVEKDDRSVMCLNHTTSKIENFEDLSNLSSLGFRGEALFMIANLCTDKGSMEIATRTENEPIGEKWFVQKNGSILNDKRYKTSYGTGTTITVRKLLGGLRARYIDMSEKSRKSIDEIKQMINHYSLNYRSIRFCFSLVSLDKNGKITQKQLQQSMDIKLSKVRALSFLLKLRKPIATNFIGFDKLEVNDKVSLEVILPTMRPESDIINVKKPLRFLSLNNRAMSLQLEIGHSINKLLNSLYKSFQMLNPIVWYINLNCDPKLIDFNIEPEKNDALFKDFDFILEQIKACLKEFIMDKLDIGEEEDRSLEFRNTKPLPETETGSQAIPIDISEPEKTTNRNISRHSPVFNEQSITMVDHIIDNEAEPHAFGKQIESRSGSGGSLSEITVIDAIETGVPNARINGRSITNGSMISEEGNWSHNLHDEPLSEDQDPRLDAQNKGSSSSLTYNYQETELTNEDLELSKDASLSNPFIIAKMKNIGKKQNPKNKLNSISSFNVNSLPEKPTTMINKDVQLKKLREVNGNGPNPSQKSLSQSVFNLDDTRIFKRQADGIEEHTEQENSITKRYRLADKLDTNVTGKRIGKTETQKVKVVATKKKHRNKKLSMFSEFTNSYSIRILYKSLNMMELSKVSKEAERILTAHEDERPSKMLLAQLRDTNKTIGKKYNLKRSNRGWYIYGTGPP